MEVKVFTIMQNAALTSEQEKMHIMKTFKFTLRSQGQLFTHHHSAPTMSIAIATLPTTFEIVKVEEECKEQSPYANLHT